MRVDGVDIDGECGIRVILKAETVLNYLLLLYLHLLCCICWGNEQFLLYQLLDVLLLLLLRPHCTFIQLQFDVEALTFRLLLLLVVRQFVGLGSAAEVRADFVLNIAGLGLPGRSDGISKGSFIAVGGIHELLLFELAVALVGRLLFLALEFAEERLQAGTKVHKIYFTYHPNGQIILA